LARWRKNKNIRIDEQALKETEKEIKKEEALVAEKKNTKKRTKAARSYTKKEVNSSRA